MSRRSITPEGLAHGAVPIPTAARVGPIVASGGILPQDPVTGVMPPEVEAQVENVFANVRSVIEHAGGSLDHIVKLSFLVSDREYRRFIDAEWLHMFPDPEDRPARHTSLLPLPPGVHVQCEMLAYVTGDE